MKGPLKKTVMRFIAILAAVGASALGGCEAKWRSPAHDPLVMTSPVVITLERGGCFGPCPVYVVSIDGDGNVTYKGKQFVAVKGTREGKASLQDVAALLRAFDAVDFESLRDDYHARITDYPTYIVTLSRNGHTKHVTDYAGLADGMPRAVSDIEEQIDRIAHTEQWVLRDGKPVRN